MFLDLRQASEQYFTSCQFLAHDLRQVISRPHTWQGLLGKDCCHGFGHTHFFTIPCLATPTNTLLIDDASACSTTSWVFTHVHSVIKISG
jgi:hypothetical protein